MERSAPLNDKEVTLHDNANTAALAGPSSSTDTSYGADVTSWRSGRKGPRNAQVTIRRNSGSGAVTLTAPVELLILDGIWKSVGVLNGGADIVIDEKVAFARLVGDVGSADNLAIQAAATSANVDVLAKPIEVV